MERSLKYTRHSRRLDSQNGQSVANPWNPFWDWGVNLGNTLTEVLLVNVRYTKQSPVRNQISNLKRFNS